MTDRGKLTCWDCDNLATYIDDPPSKQATSSDYWCEKHCPEVCPDGWQRYKIKQELIDLDTGGQIWYPYTWINYEWVGWPLVRPIEVYLWAQYALWHSIKREKEARKKHTKQPWWQIWK